jgi:P2 family phage contractile tail tube protein
MINFWTLRISDGAATNPVTTIPLEVTELTLPTITRQFNDDKRVGYLANIPYPLGYEISPLEYTTRGRTTTSLRLVSRIARTTFVFTGCEVSGDTYSTVTVTCRGFIEDNGMGDFADDGAEYKVTVRVDYIQTVIDTATVMTFDPTNYIYEVNGVNQLAAIRTTLGLGS